MAADLPGVHTFTRESLTDALTRRIVSPGGPVPAGARAFRGLHAHSRQLA